MIRLRVLPGAELTDDLQARWREIQQTQPAFASPYFCPEFTVLCAQVRQDVFAGIAEEGQRIVGFFPFQLGRRRCGRPVGGLLSDYQAFVVAPEVEWDACDLVRQCGLVVWDFDHLLACQTPFAPHVRVRAESPVMDLRLGAQAYFAQRRKATDQMQKVFARRRRLEAQYRSLRYTTHSTDPRDLALLVQWKREQYQRTDKVDILANRWTVALLERICATQTPTFGGTLSTLHADDRLIAAHLSMRAPPVWHSWFPAFDREFEKLSPGLVLLAAMAEDAPTQGLHTIDLGKGDQRYKDQFASYSIPLVEGAVELDSLATRARRLRRDLEGLVRRSPLRSLARIPGRLLRRAERRAKLR